MLITGTTPFADNPMFSVATFEDGTTALVPTASLPSLGAAPAQPGLSLGNPGAAASNAAIGVAQARAADDARKTAQMSIAPEEAALTRRLERDWAPEQDPGGAAPPAAQPPQQPASPQQGNPPASVTGSAATDVSPFSGNPTAMDQAIINERVGARWIPGTPEVSANKEAQQIRWRQGESKSVSGPDLTDEQKADLRERNQLAAGFDLMAGNTQADIPEIEAAGNKAQADLRAAAFIQDEESLATEQQKKESEYASRKARFEKALDDTYAAKPDDDRWWSSHSTFQKAMLMVSVALNGYASGLTGRDAPGLGVDDVMGLIDQDIQRQWAEIREQRGKAKNQLAMLSEEFGSLEAGRQALRAAKIKSAVAMADTIAAKTGTEVAKKAADVLRDKAQAEYYRTGIQWDIATAGNAVTETRAAFVEPRKATPGYYYAGRRKTLREILEDQKLAQSVGSGGIKNQSDALDLQRKANGTGDPLSDVDPNTRARLEADAAKRAGDFKLLYEAIDSYKKGLGAYKDPETGEYKTDRDIAGSTSLSGVLPDFANRKLGDNLVFGDEGTSMFADSDMVLDALIQAKTGAAASPEQRASSLYLVQGTGTEDSRLKQLGKVEQLAKELENEALSLNPYLKPRMEENRRRLREMDAEQERRSPRPATNPKVK